MIEYLSLKQEGFSESNYPVLIETFAKNALRPVPPATNPVGDEYDPEEDEDVLEPSWPHLSLCYDMFVKFLELPDFNATVARRNIDLAFVTRLMALFDVEDPRERDLVKTTLHRVYGKFLHLRPVIRKLMRSIFTEVTCEHSRHKIAEMLEILGSVINGFALPIREEHRQFLEKTLVPLHKSRTLPCFFQQLCFCITQFVEKDSGMALLIVPGLLRIWPKTNTTKEVLFLSELEEILARLEYEHFEPLAPQIFSRLALCMGSQHFQVAEKTLMLWNNEETLELFMTQPEIMIRIVTPHLIHNTIHHWHNNVRMLIVGVMHSFIQMNSGLFEACVEDYSNRYHLDQAQTMAEINAMLSHTANRVSEVPPGTLIAAVVSGEDTTGSLPMDIAVNDAPVQHTASMRRKSVLPSDADVAMALANYRPSPPPAPLPGE